MHRQDFFRNLKATSAGGFARPSPLLWFIAAALVAPVALLTLGGSQSNNLPWYFWGAILLLLLLVICIGFLRFTRPSNQAEDISISPDRR
jgi:ABC-type multidrug transport system permease subunit